MAIRDLSNVPDHLCPEWVVRHRDRERERKKQEAFRKKDWERIKAEVEALKDQDKD